MSNATDNLIEAEKMIRRTFPNVDDQERSLQICRWLFEFNDIENGFKIKCRRRNIPDISFCIDRFGYGDCDKEKVNTWFFAICIKKSQLIFRPIIPNKPYLKKESTNQNLLAYINYKESKNLDLETIKLHIIESYELLINNLKLVSNVSNSNISFQQHSDKFSKNVYIPTKDDFEIAYRSLTRLGERVQIDVILDRIEINLTEKRFTLKNNWRLITEENIKLWLKQ